jgi:hypothetical protein
MKREIHSPYPSLKMGMTWMNLEKFCLQMALDGGPQSRVIVFSLALMKKSF